MRAVRGVVVVVGVMSLTGCRLEAGALDGSWPYVQDVTPTGAVVAALTKTPAQLRLRLAGREVVEPEEGLSHELRLDGLQPGRSYFYSLESTDGERLGGGQLHTPPLDPAAPCHFLVVSGSQAALGAGDAPPVGVEHDPRALCLVAGAAQQRPADLLLHTGSVLAEPKRPEWRGFLRNFGFLLADVPVYPALGSHDLGQADFEHAFHLPRNGPAGEAGVYSFDWGAAHFVCLNPLSAAADAQLSWLARDLERARGRWTIVYFSAPTACPSPETERLQEELGAVLTAGGADLVLTGSPGGGEPLRREEQGYVVYSQCADHLLELYAFPDSLALRALDEAGVVQDRFELRDPR